jgi:hypothetical protein
VRAIVPLILFIPRPSADRPIEFRPLQRRPQS